jgi:hypothetical protein
MYKRYCLAALIVLSVISIPSCDTRSSLGNLAGVVVRTGSGKAVPYPVVTVMLIPEGGMWLSGGDMTIKGDELGRFEVTLPAGNYRVRIGLREQGPFTGWSDPVLVEAVKTTQRTFKIPDDLV